MPRKELKSKNLFRVRTSALYLGLAAPFSLRWRVGEDIKRRVSTSQTWVRVSFSAPVQASLRWGCFRMYQRVMSLWPGCTAVLGVFVISVNRGGFPVNRG